jgi:hypothetical protein
MSTAKVLIKVVTRLLSRRSGVPNNPSASQHAFYEWLQWYFMVCDDGSRIRLSSVPLKINAPEPDQWPYLPPFAPS